MKIAIVYHSQGGNTKKVSELVAAGARVNETYQQRRAVLLGKRVAEKALELFGAPLLSETNFDAGVGNGNRT